MVKSQSRQVSMKLCYIILAHSNLDFLCKVLDCLHGEDIVFYVHVDSKCNESIKPLSCRSDTIIASKRYDVGWGDITMVDAVMESSKEAMEKTQADYYVLLSGNDVPVKSSEYIKHYIEQHGLKNYVTGQLIPSKNSSWLEGGRRRIACYAVRTGRRDIATIEPRKFDMGNFRQIIKVLLKCNLKTIAKAFRILLFYPRRNYTGPIRFHGGEFWWRLNASSLKTIVDYYYHHPEFRNYMSEGSNPDEITFTSLIYSLCKDIINSHLTYINWRGRKSPDYLSLNDADKIDRAISSPDILFCRKVNCKEVLDYIQSKA